VDDPAGVEIAARRDAVALRRAARSRNPRLPHGARLQYVACLARGRFHRVEIRHFSEVRIAPKQRLVVAVDLPIERPVAQLLVLGAELADRGLPTSVVASHVREPAAVF